MLLFGEVNIELFHLPSSCLTSDLDVVLQGCRFQLPRLLAVHDSGAAAVPAGRERLHSDLSALEQRTTAKGSSTRTRTYICTHQKNKDATDAVLKYLCVNIVASSFHS